MSAQPALSADAVVLMREKLMLENACNVMLDALSTISRMSTVDFTRQEASAPLQAFQAARSIAQEALAEIPVCLREVRA